jgi:hypothetical protein
LEHPPLIPFLEEEFSCKIEILDADLGEYKVQSLPSEPGVLLE